MQTTVKEFNKAFDTDVQSLSDETMTSIVDLDKIHDIVNIYGHSILWIEVIDNQVVITFRN